MLAGRSPEALDKVAAQTGGRAVACDATNFDAVQDLVKSTVTEFGKLDGIVNAAGSILLKPAHLTSVEEYRDTVEINLSTAFFVVKAASRAMMKEGGSIVLLSSAVSQTGLANHEAIAAAKGGVAALARSAAASYANRGIRVNAVAPGLVETPLTQRITANEAGRKASESMHALGRLGRPEDIASAVCWLLDEEKSGWVTGQVLGVDGGLGSVRPR